MDNSKLFSSNTEKIKETLKIEIYKGGKICYGSEERLATVILPDPSKADAIVGKLCENFLWPYKFKLKHQTSMTSRHHLKIHHLLKIHQIRWTFVIFCVMKMLVVQKKIHHILLALVPACLIRLTNQIFRKSQ